MLSFEVVRPLQVVLRCDDVLAPKVRYIIDTLLMAWDIPVEYVSQPPSNGPWLFYGPRKESCWPSDRCVALAHCPESWTNFIDEKNVDWAVDVSGLAVVFGDRAAGFDGPSDIAFDIAANAFYFLSSWSERANAQGTQTRQLYRNGIYERLTVPQDIVDRYLARLVTLLDALCDRVGIARWKFPTWPGGASYALVLSHDVDFIPSGLGDTIAQGVRTVLRHLVRQRDLADAMRAASGFVRALVGGRDPYGCVPEIIERERSIGVRSSFQIAVGHRHPNDVNYRIEDDRTRDYLRAITDAGFDLCLHGSYRSTENARWYAEEVAVLTQRLGRPMGSRQHFLSFDYDTLFAAQEDAGIEYDMSMGYPDRTGPRSGFSYPYFPYCIAQDRPYNVLEIGLSIMDVTLRAYMGQKGARAWATIEGELIALQRKRGCASSVWHPIVFGGARDPGFDRLYWDMIDYIQRSGGLATDGRSINDYWRKQAKHYPSFI